MIKAPIFIAFAGLTVTFLSACAGADDRYPSLAVRDAERVQGSLTPAPSADNTPPRVVDAGSINTALEQARSAHSEFTKHQGEVGQLVVAARGLSSDDDRRAEALSGMAQLISLHGQTNLALGDLDTLEAQAASDFGETEQIRAAQVSVLRMVATQELMLESLNENLAQ